MFSSKSSVVLGSFVLFGFSLLLIMSLYTSFNELNLGGRKLIALAFGIPFLVLINLLLVTSIEKCILVLLVFYPIWQRSSYYLKVVSLPDGFYIINFQQVYLIALSFMLLALFTVREKKELRRKDLICVIFSMVILISSTINYFYTNQDSVTYNFNILIVNYYIPALLLIAISLYTSKLDTSCKIDSIIKYFFIFQLCFCFVELVSRGGSILSNPTLLLKYGLRVPSGSDGSQIITGGIRDLLYFAWLFSWMPIYFHYKYKVNKLKKNEYTFWMVVSYFVVLLTYSKSPIAILLMNTLLILKIDGVINKKSATKGIVFLLVFTALSPLLINKFFARVIQFIESTSAFFSTSDSASRSIDMTVYYRLRAIIDQVEFSFSDFSNFMIGGYSNFVEGSSFFLVSSAFGFVTLLIIIGLSLWYFINCNIYQKGVFLSFLLYSITSLESFIGVSNYKIFTQSIDYQAYIGKYGWYPQYSMGNTFVTIVLFVFVQKSLEKNK